MFGKSKEHKAHENRAQGEFDEFHSAHRPPMNRSVSGWFIIMSVLYVIIGVVIFVWPGISMDIAGLVFGVCMLAYGISRIVIYFTRSHYDTIIQMDLTVGVVFSAFGLFLLLHRDFVNAMLPFAVAILLLIGAISKLQYALDMKRLGVGRWNLFLAAAVLVFILGLILIYNPFREHYLMGYIAVSIIVEGVLNIIAILTISHRIRKDGRGAFTVTGDRFSPSPKSQPDLLEEKK